jgi:hypothetical protein
LDDQQFEAMQSASIAARAANSPKASAKNINTALMAISHYQGVPLQSEYLFHDHPPSLSCQNWQRLSVTVITFWSFSSIIKPLSVSLSCVWAKYGTWQ